MLRELTATKRGDEYCLSERGRKDLLINTETLRSWGAINQTTIERFNEP